MWRGGCHVGHSSQFNGVEVWKAQAALSTRVNGRVREDGFAIPAWRQRLAWEEKSFLKHVVGHPTQPASIFFFFLRSHLQVAFGGLLVSDGIDTSACRRITPSRGHPDGLKCNYMCWINYELLLLLLHCCGEGTQVKRGERKHVHTHTKREEKTVKCRNRCSWHIDNSYFNTNAGSLWRLNNRALAEGRGDTCCLRARRDRLISCHYKQKWEAALPPTKEKTH